MTALPPSLRRSRHQVAIWATLLTVACQGADAPAPAPFTVTDAAIDGVATVTHSTGALAAAPRLGTGRSAWSLTDGSTLGLPDLALVEYAAFTTDGRVALFAPRAGALRLIAPEGQGVTHGSVAKVLAGARELPAPIQRRDDGSLLVQDGFDLTTFSPALDATGALATPDFHPGFPWGVAGPADGTALTWVETLPFTPDAKVYSATRTDAVMLRAHAGGLDTLARWPGLEWYAVPPVQHAGHSHGDEVGWGYAGFGRHSVMAGWQQGLVVGTNDDWSLEVRGADGAVQRRIILDESATVVTEAMQEALVADRTLAIQAGRHQDEDEDHALEGLKFILWHDTLPPFESLIPSASGELWVGLTPNPTAADRSYAVFGPDGHLRHRVTLPRSDRVLAADGDRLLVQRLAGGGRTTLSLLALERQ